MYAARIDHASRAYHHAIGRKEIEVAANAAVLHRIDRAADTGLIIDKVHQTPGRIGVRCGAHMHIRNPASIQLKVFEGIDGS